MKVNVFGIMRDLDQEEREYRQRSAAISLAAQALKRMELDRIAARHELEPDEFQTADDKARRYL